MDNLLDVMIITALHISYKFSKTFFSMTRHKYNIIWPYSLKYLSNEEQGIMAFLSWYCNTRTEE